MLQFKVRVHFLLTASSLLFISNGLNAAPTTPDRPGRPTPEQAGVPNQPPTSQPVATTRETETFPANEASPQSDSDLLKQTAADLNLHERYDLQALRYFGLRPRLESLGIDIAGAETIDYSKNFHGGIDTGGDAFRNLFDFRINVDSRAAFGWYGGTFSIDFQNQNGRNGSDFLVGDAQGFDNADADGRTQIAEAWYQQLFFSDKLRLKIGKVDANTEFAFPEYGAPFLNSSFGHSPTIGMPTYPDPSMSVNAFVYPNRFLYVGVGVYDGSGFRGVNTGDYGPKHFFDGSPADDVVLGEAGARWVFRDDTLPGRVALGGWGTNADVDTFSGGVAHGTGGVYAMLEQTLWHKKFYDKTDAHGVAAFLQYGEADPGVSPIDHYAGAGITWTGPIDVASRKDDVLGFGLAYAHLTNDPAVSFVDDYELSVEAFYGLQITEYLSIKPDLQYIIHPGGTGAADALVATVRVTLAF